MWRKIRNTWRLSLNLFSKCSNYLKRDKNILLILTIYSRSAYAQLFLPHDISTFNQLCSIHSSFSRAYARWRFLISVDNAGIHIISASRMEVEMCQVNTIIVHNKLHLKLVILKYMYRHTSIRDKHFQYIVLFQSVSLDIHPYKHHQLE